MTVVRMSSEQIEERRKKYWERIDKQIYDRDEPKNKLLDFQREGVDWLGRHTRSILADDMGLGKTVQALATVTGAEAFPCLIICKASLLPTIGNQVRKWTGEKAYVMDRGDRRKSIRAMKTMPRKFFVVHYEGAVKEVEKLREFEWKTVLVDEATMIKNRTAQRTRAVKSLRAPRIHLLTGTPLLNSPMDLWSLLHMLDSKRWTSFYKFEKRYAIMGGWQNKQVIGYRNMHELRGHVHLVMKRRRKDEVLTQLPPKTYVDLMVELPTWQRDMYKQAYTELTIDISKSKTMDIGSILARLTRLKQIAVWPQATLKVERKETPVKIEALMDLLDERVEQGKKTIVFSKYVTVINALNKHLAEKMPKLQKFVFTGGHKDDEQDFQSFFGPAVWMATIDAGNMGLTLTEADMVVFMDKDWVPAMNMQAEDRAHRIGQKDNVVVVSMIAKDTIEERIEKVLVKKTEMFNSIIESDGGFKAPKITMDDIQDILKGTAY